MRRSLVWLAITLVLLTIALGTAHWLTSPPNIARLLPECDALLYANVKPLRTATHFDRTPVSRAPDYQSFMDATGIVPERDLDAVALAMHRMDDLRGPNGPVAYSEVFAGRFDPVRLERYLASIATARESYAGKTIFSIPVEDAAGGVAQPTRRLLRIAVLGRGLVAVSNAPTTEQIHAMLDPGRTGPSLLSGYGGVPTFAAAWGIGRLALPFAEGGWLTVAGLQLPVRDDAEFVASVRYLGDGVKLRVEELAGSDQNAARTVQELTPLLTLLRAVVRGQAGFQSSSSREAIDSVSIQSSGDRVILTGSLPVESLRQIASPQAIQAPR